MHGFGSGYTFLVNAEVDSMGGVVDGGLGISTKSSPRRVAIEKAQAELRLEYDVREERRRELEFLEKGGNPLDFKFGVAASVSVQSTSHTDQHQDQFLTSEAKGSFALTASPHGDSVESSGRLGVTTGCEPNSADNFDGENELLESERKSTHPGRGSITPSEHSSQLDGSQHNKDSEDSPVFHPKKGQAYRRRNRSRPNRDGPRSSSVDVASRGSHGPSYPSRQGMFSKPIASENHLEMESDGTHVQSDGTHASTSKDKEELQNQCSKIEEAHVTASGAEPDLVAGKENIVPLEAKCPPYSGAEKTDDNATTAQLSESSKMNGDGKCTLSEGPITNAVQTMKGLESESSCTQNGISIDGNGNGNGNGNVDRQLYTNLKNVNSNGPTKEHELSISEKKLSKQQKLMSEKLVTDALESGSCVKEDHNSIRDLGNGFANKDQEEIDNGRSSLSNDGKGHSNVTDHEANNNLGTKSEIQTSQLADSNPQMETSCPVRQPLSVDPSQELDGADLSAPTPVTLPQACENQLKVVDKAHEDRILEEARIIEAKHKRIAELSTCLSPRGYRRKSHWEFVLEEMTWLANDFAQERLWKMTAAAQICHRVAFASRLRLEEQNKCLKQKSVAHNLSKAVMVFWRSAQLLVENVNSSQSEKCINDGKVDELQSAEVGIGGSNKDKVSEQKLQSHECKQNLAVHKYAVRFLQSTAPLTQIEVHGSPDIGSDVCLPEYSQQDQFTEEKLLYVVPLGAMEAYRKSVESCLSEAERTCNNMQEEVDTSMYDAAADDDFGEDEGENVYYLPGAFDTRRPSKKKKKNMKSYAVRSYESGGDFGYKHCMDSRNGTPRSILIGKRPSNNLHVGPIPTKRMRTASRQRVVGSFNAGPAGVTPAPSRADVSSGDTNSFQDDQSTLHGGSVLPRGSEVDSAMDFEQQFTFDSTEVSAKPKKKKKIKHQGSTYDPRWQMENAMLNEQKDHVRKRLEGYQLDSNGNSGLFGQHAKKPKIMKHSLDSSFDNTLPMSGSVASPVASQMSNMSSQSKIIKLIGGRDRGRKAKVVKVPTGQPGLGSPWSLFEDQALVVLVHDMGPNWELVSDAINSTLQFKCIFRKPQECKERHKILMDRTSGDGADSAEDSGSSQPYPSTLPGIPKGSARQLFQRLQGPMEEDTIKSHFEKIILIGQQLYYQKKQNNNLDLKQIAPVHGSHVVALSQVFPNNVNGGILTPLDLCDTSSNQDLLSLGYQGPHAGGLGLANQGAIPSMHPPPNGLNSSFQGVQGSPSVGVGNNMASTSHFNSPRDARLSGLRPGSLPIEEQQRLQQYNQLLSGRNIQSANLPSSGALSGADRGVRMLPGGNSLGVMAGMNRSMPMPRPGLQGITSSSMLNSGNMLPSNMSVHSGAASGHGNSMFRARDALQMVRPGHSSEHQRQMMLPEMQMQGTQSNSSGVTSFGGLNSGFSAQAGSPPVQAYPGHHQQQHPISQQHSHVLSSPHHPHLPGSNHSTPEQQAILRLRERQIQQQRLLQRQQQQQHQHQHQQLPASSALINHVQTSAQLPVSSPVPTGAQVQSQTSQPVSLPPLSPSSPMTHPSQPQQQPKHQVSSHGLGQSAQSAASGMMNQVGKQRQRQAQQLQQQYQQSSRQHPQQRQLSQQQQAKILKGIGRSNLLMHQNLPMDPSPLNGISTKPGGQVADKGEQPVHLMQGQNLYSGSPLNTMQQSKSLASPSTSNNSQAQKPHANAVSATMKQVQQIPSHLDSSNRCQIPAVASASAAAAASNQGVSSAAMPSLSHHQGHLKPPVKMANQPPTALQRSIHQGRQMNSDPLTKSQADYTHVEQHFSNNSSKGNASSISTCIDSTSVIPSSSPVGTSVRKPQESLCDSGLSSSTSSGPIGSPALANSSGSEPSPSVSQVQRQLSGNLVSQGHSGGSQWQQQKSLLQQPLPLQPILSQNQSQQPLQQLEQSPQQAPQQQSQSQIQPGKGGVLTRTNDL